MVGLDPMMMWLKGLNHSKTRRALGGHVYKIEYEMSLDEFKRVSKP